MMEEQLKSQTILNTSQYFCDYNFGKETKKMIEYY